MLKSNIIRKKVTKKEKLLIFIVGTIFLLDFTLFPAPVQAAPKQDIESKNTEEALRAVILDAREFTKAININKNQTIKEQIIKENLLNYAPSAEEILVEKINKEKYKVSWSDYRTITAYNSDPRQTDDTPCITANNFNVCEHGIEDTVAANFLKFNTKIRIPDLFGDRIFIVRDRMNKRYPDRLDIWMLDQDEAWKFGRRTARIEVLK